jgi:DnaD/phage-associated family protein
VEETKKSYYAIIPANVRYAKITNGAKLLYGEITALCNEKGYCWATNKYFADLYEVDKSTIKKWLKALADNNFISTKLKYKDNSKEVETRYITIVQDPGCKNEPTSVQKYTDPGCKNKPENNTSNNTYEYIDDVVKKNRKIITYCEQYLGGSLTKQALDDLIDYIEFGMDADLIIRAVDKARDTNNRRWSYVNGILRNWKKDNIKTIEQAIEQDNLFHSKNDKPMTEEERRKKRTQEIAEMIKKGIEDDNLRGRR